MQASLAHTTVRRFAAALAATVLAVLIAAPAFAEQARQADSFVESIGVDTHITQTAYTVYHTQQAFEMMGELGVRYIRDGRPRDTTQAAFIDNLYAEYGIRTLMTVAIDSGPQDYTDQANDNPAFVGVEGLNEPDIIHNGRYYRWDGKQDDPSINNYDGSRAFQEALAQTMNMDKIFTMPAMAHEYNIQYLAPLSFNTRAIHAYPKGYPITRDQSGFADKFNTVNSIMGTDTPLWITETGYNTAVDAAQGVPGQPPTTERAQGKYTNRLLAETFNLGVFRTTIYELFDRSADTADPFAVAGIVRSDYTPKPAFYALRNLIDLVEDPGEDFTPDDLDFHFTGQAPRVHHTLLQKRDGTFLLMIWNDVLSQNVRTSTNPPTDIFVPTDNLRLHLPHEAQSINIYYNLANDNYATLSYTNLSSLVIAIPDEVIVVEIVLPESGSLSLLLVASPALARRRRRTP